MLHDLENAPIGFKFKLINEAAKKAVNESLKEHDLTYSQLSVMLFLSDNADRGPFKLKDIEQYFNLSHPTVIGLVERLAAKGIVSAAADPDDRRCTRVQLVKSQTEVKQILSAHRAYMDSIFERGLTAEEKKLLGSLLTKVVENFQAAGMIAGPEEK